MSNRSSSFRAKTATTKAQTKETAVDAEFRFDSYRLIYRYHLYQTDALQFSLGGALKVRDATIELQSGELQAEKDDTGMLAYLKDPDNILKLVPPTVSVITLVLKIIELSLKSRGMI